MAVFATAAAFAAPPGANKGTSRQTIAGTKPAWTAATKLTGSVNGSTDVSVKGWLAPRNAAQLTALARAVSDPASAQYVGQFAPSADQVSAVESWLTSAKLKVTGVGAGNHVVAVTGSASAVSSAFGTSLGLYSVNGSTQDAGNVRSDFRNGCSAAGGYVYSVRTFDQDSSLTTNKAWDDVIGVRTVTARYIANAAR